jgi:hypothetical protein
VIADVSPRTARSKRELMPMSDRSYAASALPNAQRRNAGTVVSPVAKGVSEARAIVPISAGDSLGALRGAYARASPVAHPDSSEFESTEFAMRHRGALRRR